MKKLIFYLAILGTVGSFAACATHSHGRGHRGLPPGQAKKIFGTKSAKPFAPGQQKKRGNKKGKNNNGNRHHHKVQYFHLFDQ